jgi:hypothetical protein
LDPGSQTHIFESLVKVFLGKKFYNSLKIGQIFFLHHYISKIIFNGVKYVAPKKGMAKKNFSPLSLVAVLDPGSGIRDPGSGMGKNQDPGSRINIPDPQHW